MPGSKKAHPKPTRLQPRRATRGAGPIGQSETEDITLLPSIGGGVRKAEGPVATAHQGKSRGPPARKLKKLQQALIKRVDARDPDDAWAEQSQLLGLVGEPIIPLQPRVWRRPDGARAVAVGTAAPQSERRITLDDITSCSEGVPDGKPKRANRWIPDMEHRRRPASRPPGTHDSLWLSYQYLDEYMYLHSLSPAELEALPLREDVQRYKDTDGAPKPIPPPGFRWDEHRELVPV